MVYPIALLIFVAASSAIWYTAVALYDALVGGPRRRDNPDFVAASGVTIGITSLSWFVPFPGGYVIALIIDGLTARSGQGLSWARGTLLFVLLAVVSFVVRLAIYGAANY